MRKWICMLLAAVMLMSMAACAPVEPPEQTVATAPTYDPVEPDENGVYTIVVPAKYATTTQEELDNVKSKGGIEDGTVDDAGVITYKMTQQQRSGMLASLAGMIESTMKKAASGEERNGIARVESNEEYTEFRVRTVDEAPTVNTIHISSVMRSMGELYSIFMGVPAESVYVTVIFQNYENGDPMWAESTNVEVNQPTEPSETVAETEVTDATE